MGILSRRCGGWLPLEDFFPSPSLSTTELSQVMRLVSAGSALRTRVGSRVCVWVVVVCDERVCWESPGCDDMLRLVF